MLSTNIALSALARAYADCTCLASGPSMCTSVVAFFTVPALNNFSCLSNSATVDIRSLRSLGVVARFTYCSLFNLVKGLSANLGLTVFSHLLTSGIAPTNLPVLVMIGAIALVTLPAFFTFLINP